MAAVDIEVILPKVKNPKKNRPTSIWRDDKTAAHTTINGEGKIAKCLRNYKQQKRNKSQKKH